MRKNIKSLSIMLWLVVIAFIGSAIIGGALTGRSGPSERQGVIAWVNGKPISNTTFENRYRTTYGWYKQIYGDNLTRDMIENLQLPQNTLNQLTQEALLIQEAQKHNLYVSDEELIRSIQDMSQFQSNNQFNPEIYQNTLSRIRMSPEEFEEQVMEGLLVDKIEHLIKQTVRLSDQELLQDYIAQNEKIEVEGFLVKTEKFQEQAEFTEEEVQQYYEAHKETFMTPERVKIQYIHFDPQQLKDEVTVSEDELSQYYEEHQSEFHKEKEVKARHILFQIGQEVAEETVTPVQEKAEDVLRQLKEGADFAELAQQYSDDPGSKENGGDLGFFTRGSMVPEFEEVAFSLEAGQMSELVRSQFGFHIIQVDEVREEEKEPYDTAKSTITDRLKSAKAKETAAERVEVSYNDLLETGNLLHEVASKDQLEVQVSDFFAKGERIDDKTFALPQIQDVAFTLSADNKFSPPIETPLGYYIIEFLEFKEPYIQDLTEVKDNASDAVRQKKAEELAKAEAQKIEKALAEGIAWEEITTQYPEVEAFAPQPFSRRQQYIPEAQGKTEDVIKIAFALQDGKQSSVIELSATYAIIRVKERTGIDTEVFQKEKDSLKQQLLRQKQDTVLREFVEELRQSADIEIAPGLFS